MIMEPSHWMTDLYLKTSRTRDEVFAFLEAEGFGTKQPQYSIVGNRVALSLRRNPDCTGSSPFGQAPWVLEVARPAGVLFRDFKAAYQGVKDCLKRNGIPFESSRTEEETLDAN